ncbi:MAG: RHS repeat-associated core domain-containing protein [Fibrobacter sp.]|nr:RHS repeat-associated core domain-containing protein [Fibrobacter sp.]
MFKIYLIPFIFAVLSVFSYAEEEQQEPPEQIYNSTHTWLPDGTRFGMPGLANIWAHDVNHPHFTDFIPTGSDVVVVPLKHEIRYGGSTYNHLTIASGARIFLGDYENYIIPADGVDGSYPYVKPIIPRDGIFLPAPGNTQIPVAWRNFDEHGDEFTVLEIGPFFIDQTYPTNNGSGLVRAVMLCQVSFYGDGEIQVQYWIQENARSVAYSINPSAGHTLGFVMNSPYVYNGAKRIQKETLIGALFKQIDILDNGKLREGWIGKSFVNGDLKIDEKNGEIEIDFGTGEYPGVVLAYDHARENPVVGSFSYIHIVTSPVYVENAHNEDPIYIWYFNESGSFVNKTEDAGYPYLDENAVLQVSDQVKDFCQSLKCVSDKTIYPATYNVTWNDLKSKGINVDTISAPAIKIQVDPKDPVDRYRSRSPHRTVRIKNITAYPVQPLSIQFRPPTTKDLKYEGAVGYLEVAGRKAPLKMPEGAMVDATIHSAPGFLISKIEVNGNIAYDESNPSNSLPNVYVDYRQERDVATVRLVMDDDKLVHVSYRNCTQRNLPEVVPSYVKNEIFLDPKDKSKVVTTYSIKDGFDRVVQTQEDLGNGKFSVSALYFDYAGNTQYAPKTFVTENKTAYSFEEMYCRQCIAKSAAFYNGDTAFIKSRVDASGYPYAEHNYHYGENKAIVGESAGMGEASFDKGKKFINTWKIPIATYGSDEFFTIEQLKDKTFGLFNGSGSALDNEYLGRLTTITEDDLDVNKNEFDYPYVLTINQALDGSFSQSIADGAGNVHALWTVHDGEVLISRNIYNLNTSQLDRSYVEKRYGFEMLYTYDDAGRLIAVKSPDRGRKETKYDSKNRIRFSRDERQIAKGGTNKDFFNVIVYDDQDRVVQTGEVRGSCGGCSFDKPDDVLSPSSINLLSETIYGKPTVNSLRSKSFRLGVNLATDIVNSIEGVSFYDVGATISYDGKGNVNTMKFSSFDRLGRLKTQWTVYLFADDAPAIKTDYEYTSSGQIARSVASEWDASQNSWTPLSKRVMAYGQKDRLEKIYEQDATDDSKKWELARYSYDAAGSLESMTYFDKGQKVYTMSSRGDINGRVTRIRYGDAAGDDLYVEELGYSDPLLNRVSSLTHTWKENSGKNKVVEETFDYDDLGRLTTFNTDMASMTGGQYSYDILGRTTAKSEAGTSVAFSYFDGSYRPASISIDGVALPALRLYDASGNVWLDQRKNYAYSLNSLGLPDRIRKFSSTPSSISLDMVDGSARLTGEDRYTDFLYDESGRQIWKQEKSWTETTSGTTTESTVYQKMKIPGVGEYFASNGGALHFTNVDLVGGGHRLGRIGSAYFPMTDAQGNIRGYASKIGLESMYAYYPYGAHVELVPNNGAGMRRWQSKEYDGYQDKYDFGARYYDPFLGLWMSPDPAGQFANSYTYGGDPVNYIDPTGMWSFGVGLIVSWDEQHGWGFGVGLAGGGAELSYVYNYQDASNSFNASVGGSYQFYALNLNASLGYNFNSYTGHTLSVNGGACLGNEEVACAGVEVGGALYWSASGNFMGSTAYLGAYATFAGGLARVSSGYEAGFMGMEGRGLYAGATVAGLHAEVSERDGYGWGLRESLYFGIGNNVDRAIGEKNGDIVSLELTIPTLGRFGNFTFGDRYDVSPEGSGAAQDAFFEDNINDKEKGIVLKRDVKKDGKNLYSDGMVAEIHKQMMANGYSVKIEKAHTFWNHHEGDKYTYYKDGSRGNVEIIKIGNNNSYASYNYGNNRLSHFFIDYIGYHWRKW